MNLTKCYHVACLLWCIQYEWKRTMISKTLTLKKPVNSALATQKKRPEYSLVGQDVIIQTKSPSRITGRVNSFDGGWIVNNCTEHR